MSVSFSSEWTFRGLQALIVENTRLRVTILPELGGKIWSIIAKGPDREMLWHNPRVPPRLANYGDTYDNWFCGGWDEIFPNDYPVTIAGESYPDHGEIWALSATWSIVENTPERVAIQLQHHGIALATTFTKTVALQRDSTDLIVTYEIRNDGSSALDVHWKLHPALPIASGARLHLPARHVIVDPDFGEDAIQPLELPNPDSGTSWFQYGTNLESGACAISYPEDEIGFALTFDPEVLTSVWTFASFGGWRDLNMLILEPCTGHFPDLEKAIEEHTVLSLTARSKIETTVTASVLIGSNALNQVIGRDS